VARARTDHRLNDLEKSSDQRLILKTIAERDRPKTWRQRAGRESLDAAILATCGPLDPPADSPAAAVPDVKPAKE
jgi:hypothetical protein